VNRWLAILLLILKRIEPPPKVDPPTTPTGSDLLDEVNKYRARHGRQPFQADQCCTQKALQHARDVSNGAAPHSGFSARARECSLASSGENWAQARTAAESVSMWDRSPGHKSNMLGDWQFGGAAISGESAVLFCGDRQALFVPVFPNPER
jgi:uncharacterized protein YkwD